MFQRPRSVIYWQSRPSFLKRWPYRCTNETEGLGSALFWDITQRRVIILYRHFGTTCRSRLQESRNTRRFGFGVLSCWTFWPLKRGLIGCPETSVQNYHSTLRNIPEERRSQAFCLISTSVGLTLQETNAFVSKVTQRQKACNTRIKCNAS